MYFLHLGATSVLWLHFLSTWTETRSATVTINWRVPEPPRCSLLLVTWCGSSQSQGGHHQYPRDWHWREVPTAAPTSGILQPQHPAPGGRVQWCCHHPSSHHCNLGDLVCWHRRCCEWMGCAEQNLVGWAVDTVSLNVFGVFDMVSHHLLLEKLIRWKSGLTVTFWNSAKTNANSGAWENLIQEHITSWDQPGWGAALLKGPWGCWWTPNSVRTTSVLGLHQQKHCQQR